MANAPGDLAYFYPTGHEGHSERGHVERPERVETIRSALQTSGWWDQYPKYEPIAIPESVLYTIHDPTWIAQLQTLCQRSNHLDPDTYLTPATYNLALRAAGGTAALAQAIWQGSTRRGFSLARPPGHHATYRHGGGFCLLNNIALAAEILIQEEQVQRLAIIDYDLHHGNGTQDIFWKRGDILYISIHQMPLFPGTGWLNEVGEAAGEGLTANFPLPPGSGDRAYSTVSDEFVIPLLGRFKPQMVLVSFGFDPHWRDPLGSLLLSASQYGRLISSLVLWAEEYCAGKILLVLEGGYDLSAGSACSLAATAALFGVVWEDPLGPSPYQEQQGWRSMVTAAKELWQL